MLILVRVLEHILPWNIMLFVLQNRRSRTARFRHLHSL